ncbi:FHA domain-containing protein [Micromonosporaceae bacterium Da 78-11]
MTTYACPKGHASETDDFCDTCGAKIGGAEAAPTGSGSGPTSAAPVAGVPAGGTTCPNCGTPRAGASRFCEDCGYDHSTGKIPVLTPVSSPPISPSPLGGGAPAALSGWTATIEADRAYFDANAIEGADFPAETGRRTLDLPSPQVRIGRRSSSKGTNPEIDLSETDPGVSHSHALLTLSVDGSWLVSDLGSTNGTYLNDEDQPLTSGETRALKDGDQVHVGGWTTITLHAPTP